MKSVLYFPDGNRRYAKKNNTPLFDSYALGLEKIKLCTEFFVKEKKAESLIFVIYTYIRKDSTYDDICKVCEIVFEKMFNEGFFQKLGVRFRVISNFGLPDKLGKIFEKLYLSTKENKNGEVIVLFGYYLEEDFNQALLSKPKDYTELRNKLMFPEIDLVVRNCEIRLSNAPLYALGKAQMIKIDKLNPEVTRQDLDKLWEEYCSICDYRKSLK